MTQLSPISIDRIARVAPSVFAEHPHEGVSAKYSFISTSDVLEKCIAEGLVPVSARQSRAKADRRDFTRHELRLVREADLNNPLKIVGDTHYQVCLTNSHDRAAAFTLNAGLFRLVCSNGMTVPVGGHSAGFKVRHTGDVSEVIEGVFEVLEAQDDVLGQIDEYRSLLVPVDAQVAFAKAALELRDSTIELTPETILRPRRWLDADSERSNLPKPDLWTTLNVVQENLQKGGVRGTSATGRRLRTRALTDISADQKLNKALFVLADALKAQL